MKEYIEREAVCAACGGPRAKFCSPDCILFDVPAADVVERKRGEWIEVELWWDDVYYDCSICGESFCLIDGTPTDNMYNFCPNCGADMRGEKHEAD